MVAGRYKKETRTGSTTIPQASFPLSVSPESQPGLKSRHCTPEAQRKSSREALYFWSKEQEGDAYG